MLITDANLSLAHGVLRSAVKRGDDSITLAPAFVCECMRELRERRLKDEVKAGSIGDAAAAMKLTVINAQI
jgi:hypothetical protein